MTPIGVNTAHSPALVPTQPYGPQEIDPFGANSCAVSPHFGYHRRMSARHVPDRVQSVGTFVRERRKAKHLTQAELAELAGVGLRFLKELEAGKPTARMDVVNAVLAPFGKQLGVVDRPRAPDDEADGS
jgi:y4mF family transcriptional regulator